MSEKCPMVFMDTCVFKAARRAEVFGAKEPIRDGSGEVVGYRVPLVEKNPNESITDAEQREECNLVESVAGLVREGRIRAVTSPEALLEFVGIRRTFPGSGGMLHGATYTTVQAPVALSYAQTAPKEELRASLEAIEAPRFLEIRNQVGAWQGETRVRLNQLFDAFLLWTAESAGCRFFLTVEKKLPRYDIRSESLECVRPSALIAAITSGSE